MDVGGRLRSLGLGQYEAAFRGKCDQRGRARRSHWRRLEKLGGSIQEDWRNVGGTYLDAGSEAVTREGHALKKSSAIRTLPRLSNPFMIVNFLSPAN
jgi:hypothetical protein